MKKLIYILILFLVLVGLWIFLPGREETDQSIVRIGYAAELNNSAFIIALENGYFNENNVEVEPMVFGDNGEIRLALISGEADLVFGSLFGFLPAIAQGAPIKAITSMILTPNFIFVRPDSGITTFKDLEGKKVNVGLGGLNEITLRLVLDEEGIDTGKIEFTDLDHPYPPALLMGDKRVDSMFLSSEQLSNFIKEGAVVLPEWEDKNYSKMLIPRKSIIVSTSILNEHEGSMIKILDSLAEAHRFIKSSPSQAAGTVAEHISKNTAGAVNYSPESIVSQWGQITFNVIWQDTEFAVTTARQAKEFGIIDRDLTVEEIYDLRFSEKLQRLQNEIYGTEN